MTLKTEHDAALMATLAVLPEEDALPSAETEATIYEWDDFCSTGEGHFDMAGHIVGPLVGMGKVRIIFWYQTVDETFEVAPRRGIRVLHNHQTAACVAAKHCDGTFVKA